MENKKQTIIIMLIIIAAIESITVYFIKKGDDTMQIDGGVVKDRVLKGYSENIKSNEITFFEYHGRNSHFLCELKEQVLHVTSKGGNISKRDGTYFSLDYNAKDKTLLNDLQNIIEKQNISRNNGYEYEVAGLPEGLGDNISVKYKSGEKIWKYSNQSPTLSEKAANDIYEAFYKSAKDNNLDFTSVGSNTILYDDATEKYVQGIWKGSHFGKEYKVIFDKNKVKIYEDGKLTDDVEYKIIQGDIVPNKLKTKITNPKDRYDYEEFSIISTIRKKNDFTMIVYFTKDSYSTCDLLKQK